MDSIRTSGEIFIKKSFKQKIKLSKKNERKINIAAIGFMLFMALIAILVN